jgi:hypothetical protein
LAASKAKIMSEASFLTQKAKQSTLHPKWIMTMSTYKAKEIFYATLPAAVLEKSKALYFKVLGWEEDPVVELSFCRDNQGFHFALQEPSNELRSYGENPRRDR